MEDVIQVTDAPPMKKFKQVRLPFKPIDVKCQITPVPSINKKRKLSDQESPSAKAPKAIKQAGTDNFKTPVLENDPEVSSSSEAENLPLNSAQKSKTMRSNILKHFVRKSSQEEITSTINDVVNNVNDNSTELINSKTPERKLLQNNTNNRLSIDKTSTPKPVNNKSTKTSTPKHCVDKKQSPDEKAKIEIVNGDGIFNTSACDLESSIAKIEVANEIVEISDDEKTKNNSEDEMKLNETQDEIDNSLDKSSSLDESKFDVSLLSSPGKSSTGGLDSSVCETSIGAVVSGNGKTPINKKPRSSLKLSEKKKQERAEMRLRIKEQKEKERLEKKIQKEKEIQERKQKIEEARLEKEKIKKEEKEQKERERQEKIEKIEKEKLTKLQQKEEDKLRKQELSDARQEEKKKKEEDKKIKEEEKRKEDEEKLKKKNKVKAAFEGFFVKHNVPVSKAVEVDHSDRCRYYEVKKNTYRAPRVWRVLKTSEKVQFDAAFQSQESQSLYTDFVKSISYKPRKADPEQYKQKKNLDVELIIHDSETVKKITHHIKYLYFHTNYRPPYYGTWRKKSNKLTARNPFKMDSELFDYEVDSDDEWEEEEPGESLSSSEGEDNEEKEDEDEDDNGWMVPHGYLSEDECGEEDKEITPELLKMRQQAKADQWEAELKRQCRPVKTVVIGCYWEEEERSHVNQNDVDILQSYTAVCLFTTVPVHTTLSTDKNTSSETPRRDKSATSSGCKGLKAKSVPEEAISDLIRLIHGNTSGIKKLIHEFRFYWKQKTVPLTSEDTEVSHIMQIDDEESPKKNLNESMKEENTPAKEDEFSISKRQLEIKISALAVREKRSTYKKICWHVHENILKQYNLEYLTYPNNWQYLTVTKKTDNLTPEIPGTPCSSKTEEDLNNSVCDENLTPKALPKDQRSIMDFAKKVNHPPEILAKPAEVIVTVNSAKATEPDICKPVPCKPKPNILKLLNATTKQDSAKSSDVQTDISKSEVDIVAVNNIDFIEDSNGCIVLD